MTYHISSQGNVSGPFTLTQLQNMWLSGSVTADSFYWQEGFDEWQPIASIIELLKSKQKVSIPSPSPIDEVQRAWAEVMSKQKVSKPPSSPMASYKQAEVATSVPCPSCGHANTDTATSCTGCGTTLAPHILAPPVTLQAEETEPELTASEWIICILCSGIGCIYGIIRLIQGKPNAGKIIGVSIFFAVLWFALRIMIMEIMGKH